MVILLAVLVFLVLSVILWRAVEGLLNGVVGGVIMFARGTRWTAGTLWHLSRILWASFVRLQIATAQRLYAWWFSFYWRWQRRYIARALWARRKLRHS
jgi:hypothetical protein